MQFNNADVVSDSSDPLWPKKIYFLIPFRLGESDESEVYLINKFR